MTEGQANPGQARQAHASRRSTSGSSREIEVVGTGLPRGLKIGTRPVAGFVGERLVAPAGFGPMAVVFMIGQEPGQVAKLGPGARRLGTPAVAVGTERRAMSQRRTTKLAQVGRLDRLEPSGCVGVDPDVIGVVHRHAGRADPLVGPDRVQQPLEGSQLSFGKHRNLASHLVENTPLLSPLWK
ncbi:MAG: hypothetical protein ACXVBO_12355 [Isosphaeraceae bacterium]